MQPNTTWRWWHRQRRCARCGSSMMLSRREEHLRAERPDCTVIPFGLLKLEGMRGKWGSGNVNELLKGSEKMLADFKSDPKATMLRLSNHVDDFALDCRHEDRLGRFTGVLAQEWPSLAAQILARGVRNLSLGSDGGSPFNENIAINFIKLIKPLLPYRFSVTLPLNVNDRFEFDDWRMCTICKFRGDSLKRLEIRQTQDDPLDFFNPRLFDIAE
ncbi:hypothetical protein PMAYCL1PPCAC_14381 [Pristionchus mayeri]|uniref:Uncharacterized protein n=1 Tax=Pristionchus mayeri TaxID=1317129 RepID=A0AAN4ZS78_9BILA|nr:hypothetical protein PMAYCL1PPCAC_14381 [Pristionchus mayeri]